MRAPLGCRDAGLRGTGRVRAQGWRRPVAISGPGTASARTHGGCVTRARNVAGGCTRRSSEWFDRHVEAPGAAVPVPDGRQAVACPAHAEKSCSTVHGSSWQTSSTDAYRRPEAKGQICVCVDRWASGRWRRASEDSGSDADRSLPSHPRPRACPRSSPRPLSAASLGGAVCARRLVRGERTPPGGLGGRGGRRAGRGCEAGSGGAQNWGRTR